MPEKDIQEKTQILDADGIRRALLIRIAHEILERNKGTENLVLIGVRRRGAPIAQRLAALIKEIEGAVVPLGIVDIPFTATTSASLITTRCSGQPKSLSISTARR